MSDISIRNDFYEGIQEVYTSLFNEAKTPDDGVQFFAYLSEEGNIYKEHKFKTYKSPITLVASVKENLESGDTDVKAQKRRSIFSIPLKELNLKGIEDLSKQALIDLRKGLMKYKDIYYDIDLIQGKIFVENVYMVYEFHCTEIFDIGNLNIKIEEEPESLDISIKEES